MIRRKYLALRLFDPEGQQIVHSGNLARYRTVTPATDIYLMPRETDEKIFRRGAESTKEYQLFTNIHNFHEMHIDKTSKFEFWSKWCEHTKYTQMPFLAYK